MLTASERVRTHNHGEGRGSGLCFSLITLDPELFGWDERGQSFDSQELRIDFPDEPTQLTDRTFLNRDLNADHGYLRVNEGRGQAFANHAGSARRAGVRPFVYWVEIVAAVGRMSRVRPLILKNYGSTSLMNRHK